MKNNKGLTRIGEQIYGILRLIRSPKAFPHLWQSDYNSLCVPTARTKRYASHRKCDATNPQNCLKSSTRKDFSFRVHYAHQFSVKNITGSAVGIFQSGYSIIKSKISIIEETSSQTKLNMRLPRLTKTVSSSFPQSMAKVLPISAMTL